MNKRIKYIIGGLICKWCDVFCRPKITRADVERKRVADSTLAWADRQFRDAQDTFMYLSHEGTGWTEEEIKELMLAMCQPECGPCEPIIEGPLKIHRPLRPGQELI